MGVGAAVWRGGACVNFCGRLSISDQVRVTLRGWRSFCLVEFEVVLCGSSFVAAECGLLGAMGVLW